LNFGITGTLMRGGGGAATLEALPIPLGSTDILLNAPFNAPAFGRLAPKCPVAPEPAPRANEAAGEAARTARIATAIFVEVFDMAKLHYDSLERRMREPDVGAPIPAHH
jgi:hypothetical protein